MPPNGDTWRPRYVVPPANDPQGRTFFDWKNDEKLKEWKNNAIKLQDVHVRDNNLVKAFNYKIGEGDALELRILVAIYGVRTPTAESKSAPSSPLHTYKRGERDHARKLKKTILKNSDASGDIAINVIYISFATKVNGEGEFEASEEPVFVVGKSRIFIDKDCRKYDNFDDYKNHNKLPKAVIVAPKDGTYTPEQLVDDKVPLEACETPATSFFERSKKLVDTVMMIGGMALSVTGVVSYFSPGLFSTTVMKVIRVGSFYLTRYNILGAGYGIYHKTGHDENIRTEAFLLISSALSSYSGILRAKAISYAQAGKTYTELMQDIRRAQRMMFAVTNIFTIVSTSITMISSIFDLINKRERTWLDYYQLSMGFFMLMNVVTKPVTLKKVFESEQMQHLKRIHDNLQSDEAKEHMSKMSKGQAMASDQKAYMIRNLNRIKDPTEFFELIKKTKSDVRFTADGLAVNDKIDISPAAYNDIGDAVFIDKTNQNKKYANGIFAREIKTQFDPHVLVERREAFHKGLDDIAMLPAHERETALKNFLKLHLDGDLPDQTFNDAWEEADTAFKNDVKKQIDNAVEGLQQGIKEPEQNGDFDKINELMTKEANGSITLEEKENLQEQMKKCSRHRKEYIFQSSADHRSDPNYQETMDDCERNLAGGKILEEWKMTLDHLETRRKHGTINQAQYDEDKRTIDKEMNKAKHFREFRDRADRYVHFDPEKTKKEFQNYVNVKLQITDPTSKTKPGNVEVTGGNLINAFVKGAEVALQKANASGDPVAIADATEKLNVVAQIDSDLVGDVIDKNRAFQNDIVSFTNGQNERLCYRIDVEQGKSQLQHIYQRPNVEDITVNGEKIFANMKISDYNSLNRVLKECGVYGQQMILIATKMIEDNEFLGKIPKPTSHDMTAIIEAIMAFKKTPPEQDTKTCVQDLASGKTYAQFRNDFNNRITEVNKLDPSTRSQWSGILTMAYHWWKHEEDFSNKAITAQQYFQDYANSLFREQNATVVGFTQSSVTRQTYMRYFKDRVHIGFTVGPSNTRVSHFCKNRPRENPIQQQSGGNF